MRVLLLNDTALSPHVGSLAVSSAIERLIGEVNATISHRVFVTQYRSLWDGSEASSIANVENSPVAEMLNSVDAVVLNGEGTMHHDNGLHYLAILGASQQRGLKTLMVNSLFEEINHFKAVIQRLDECICRDPLSLLEARLINPDSQLHPDLIIEAEPFWDKDCQIDLTNQIICTDWHPHRSKDVGRALLEFMKVTPKTFFYPFKHGVQRSIWRSALANFSSAAAVVAARYHAVYLAILAGLPCVMLESNSHKMEALLHWLGEPLVLCNHAADLETALRKAKSNRAGFLELRHKLLSYGAFKGFSKFVQPYRRELCNENQRPMVVKRYQSQPHLWLLQTPEKAALEAQLFGSGT